MQACFYKPSFVAMFIYTSYNDVCKLKSLELEYVKPSPKYRATLVKAIMRQILSVKKPQIYRVCNVQVTTDSLAVMLGAIALSE